MIKVDKKALTFKPGFENIKIFAIFIILLILTFQSYNLYEIYKPYTLFLVPIFTLFIGFVFLWKIANLITYSGINSPLDSREYAILNSVIKTNKEVNEYISAKISNNINITKRDFYYLNIPDLHKEIKKNEFKVEIAKLAELSPDQTSMVSDVLNDLSIDQPLSFKEDNKKAMRKKIKSALFFILFSLISAFMVYILQFYNIEMRFKLFPVFVISLLVSIIFFVNVFFSHKQLIEDNLVDEGDYEKIHQLAKFDIKIVEYLKGIKEQGRLLYVIDLHAMFLERRFQVLQDVKYASLWQESE